MAPPAPIPSGPESRRARAALPTALVVGLLLIDAASGPRPDIATAAERTPLRSATSHGLSTFAEFHSGALADYESCQLKLTYMGAQSKRRSTLAAVSTLRAGGFDLGAFAPFQYHGSYNNDSFVGDTLRVTPAELKGFLDSIALHVALQDTTPPLAPHVSLMIIREYGAAALGWEHITASFAEGDLVFELLRGALAGSGERATVDRFRHHLVGIRR